MTTTETLDLAVIVRILRRYRGLVAAAAIVGSLIGGITAATLWKYKSEGIYTIGALVAADAQAPTSQFPLLYEFMPGVKLEDFKVFYPQLDSEHLHQFLARKGIEPSDKLERLLGLLESSESRMQVLSPVYGATSADLRMLGTPAKPMENRAIALQISVSASNPAEATKSASVLGDFVGESLFASQAALMVARRLREYKSEQLTLENTLIGRRFAISTMSDKIKRVQALRREFPNAVDSRSRQVVSIANGGARYLSPVAQLIGLESTVIDMRQEIAMNERALNVAGLLATYYRNAKKVAGQNPMSKDLLSAFERLIATSFTSAGTDAELGEAKNDALLDLYSLRSLREQGLRFASGPTDGWRNPGGIWKAAIVGAIIGAILVAFAVLVAHASRDTSGA